MKRIASTLCIIALVFGLLSCTRNDGDIGDWFGTWRVEKITIDGETDDQYPPHYIFWKFQSSVIQIMEPNDFDHTSVSCFGTWEQIDNKLLINLDYETGTLPAGSLLELKSELEILKLSRKEITLKYIDHKGRNIVYSLKKWG